MPFVASGQGSLFYEVTEIAPPWRGEVDTILFHHGIGVDSGLWADWIPVLADSYRILRFDMRGFGRSAGAAPGFAWSIPNLVRDLIAVADAAGAGRFHYVGESMGGTIGMAAALEAPERFRTLTVTNGAHKGGSIRNVELWQQIFDRSGPAGWSATMMEGRFFDDSLPEDKRRWFEANQASHPPSSTLDAIRTLVGADLSARLGELRLPVLLLHGDSSPFIPVGVMAEMHAQLPDSEFQVFAHAKHGLPFSHGAECARVLRGFLARRAAAAGR